MGNLNKYQLTFDPSDTANSDVVGAYTLDGSGTAITSTGGSLDVNITNAGGVQVSGAVADDAADSGNPIKVGYRAESGALTALDDGDRADALSDEYRRLYVNSSANVGVASQATTIDDTAGGKALPASNLAGRRWIMIDNTGTEDIEIGVGSLTFGTHYVVRKKSTVGPLELGDDINLKAITDTGGSVSVRTFEAA